MIRAIVPARGGSKGLPEKNLLPINGRRLYVWAWLVARDCGIPFWVSTDDGAVVRDVERDSFGGDIIPRPHALAQDDTPMIDVIQHAADWIGGADPGDGWLILQPTAPFRLPQDIAQAVELLHGHTSVTSYCVTPGDWHPSRQFWLDTHEWCLPTITENQRRQELRPCGHRNGAIYLVRHDTLCSGSLYGDRPAFLEMPRERSINIDDAYDLAEARRLYERHCGDWERARRRFVERNQLR